MRIGLGLFRTADYGGVANAQRSLIAGLASIADEHDLALFGTEADYSVMPKAKNVTFHRVRGSELRTAIERAHVDVFHGLAYIVPMISVCPTIVTIFDLIPFRNTDRANLGYARWFRKNTVVTAKLANRVVTVSNHVKQQIIETLDLPEAKINVVNCGLLPVYTMALDGGRPYEGLGRTIPPGMYVLYVGGVSERKNLRGLLKAYERVKKVLGARVSLVIVNGLDENGLIRDLRSIVGDFVCLLGGSWNPGLYRNDGLIVTGPLDYADIRSLYRSASVFVYPSLDEGFGLPPVEAMACGCPVVASDASCIPEILGKAARLVNTANDQELAEAIIEVLRDKKLASSMITEGIVNAQRYFPKKVAGDMLRVYEEVVEGSVLR